MPDFNNFLSRHGESLMQEIVERIERNEGILAHLGNSLEERWNALKQDVPCQDRLAA